MELTAFTARVEQELQTRRVAFDLAELLAFLEDSRRAVEENPDPSRWADAFLKRQRVEAIFRRAAAEGAVPYFHGRERDGGG
jgi:hypothetical protein